MVGYVKLWLRLLHACGLLRLPTVAARFQYDRRIQKSFDVHEQSTTRGNATNAWWKRRFCGILNPVPFLAFMRIAPDMLAFQSRTMTTRFRYRRSV